MRTTKPETLKQCEALAGFWSMPPAELLRHLNTTSDGLSVEEARRRLVEYGANRLRAGSNIAPWMLLLRQFLNPIILILIGAAVLSAILRDPTDATIILVIVLLSGLLGFFQEKGASDAVQKLLALVQIKAQIRRGGSEFEIPAEHVVPGDIVILNAGDMVPGDGALLDSKGLFVDEAALTGEALPAEKMPGIASPASALPERTNSLFMGTHVVSGTARLLVVFTGTATEFGKITTTLKLKPPDTEFERGVRRFGYMLMEVTFVLILAMFAINVYLARPVLDSFLFALALAVGLTPQLLPAIISVNLAHGAKRMAAKKVIVKRLAAIENFGSMNVLCADKTGTLTEPVMQLRAGLDMYGQESSKVLQHAVLNAFFQTGYTNAMDAAILARQGNDTMAWRKLDEEPYDFRRRRLSVLAAQEEINLMVTKGALPGLLNVCSYAEVSTGATSDMAGEREQIETRFEEFSRKGFRILGIAYKLLPGQTNISQDDEVEMVFLGFLLFSATLKPGIVKTLADLKRLQVSLKMITGDHRLVAMNVSQRAGIASPRLLTGPELRRLSNEALIRRVNELDVFAEVEPQQKERIILALQKAGNVVGYMGDGINDASALHAADVGISAFEAVDVAKEAADIVLMEKDLAVLEAGVREGRRTFANTLKYVFMATSANFGNMFSMAGVSLFLPFLPLLPKQILLANLLTDFPEMTIATDRVDPEFLAQPHRWDIRFIRHFMITFGLVSSIFDYLTFGVLLLAFHTQKVEFRAAWFVESVVSASLVVLVVRTRAPFFKSRPSTPLLVMTVLVGALALVLPFTPVGRVLGFVPLSIPMIVALGIIVALYVVCAEVVKRIFYRRTGF